MRPIPSAAVRRLAIAPAPRVASFVPKTVSWQAVRCYASGGSLERQEVYERIKSLLSGFDKVGLANHTCGRRICFASGPISGVLWPNRS
jgi:hypothetical protein